MLHNSRWTMLLLIIGFIILASWPCLAQQQANLSDIGNATVTLYYYDKVNETKGAIVNMSDNPQLVNNDPSLSAPGMFTFSHVPTSQWYYLEADHYGSKWYTIFYMDEGVGTKTANVHIPPFTALNATPSTVPSVAANPTLTATPMPTSTANVSPASATPGFTFLIVLMALGAAGIAAYGKRR